MQVAASPQEHLFSWLHGRDASSPITLIETHISIIAFQGDRAYKLKKDVHFPFVDLSTPERRQTDCEREVELNRRLAPDVYLGVEGVRDEAGRVVDHVVVMRRMPEDHRLSTLAAMGAEGLDCVSRVARLVADFHATAATGRAIDAAATRDAIARLWEREIVEYAGTRVDIATLARRYLAGRKPLFDARIEAGRVRDGHGDLLADDIFCLDDDPRVLDCLEFDDQLRYGDVLADVAFLAMDLERLDRVDLADRFLSEYRAASGDRWPASLEHFYVAYRAHVRAKVASLSGDDEGARARLALAADHLERGRVRLVIIGGPPATGKSTVARAIGAATGWAVLRSDAIRKELAGLAPSDVAEAPLDEGLYRAEWTERTYATLCERAAHHLTHGESVVLDATFGDPRRRDLAARVAAATWSDLIAFRCDAPADVAMARAAERANRPEVSDAGPAIAAAAAARFTAWPGAGTLDTTKPPTEVADIALAAVGRY